MKENFEATLKFVLEAEGGYTVDHAGATQMGITIGLMKALKLDLDGDGDTDADDVKLVNADTVRQIFRKEFWNRVNADNLPGSIDLQAADFAYNAGPIAAANILYGNLDPALYRERRIAFYESLCARNPGKYLKYRNGWINRAMAAYEAAVQLMTI